MGVGVRNAGFARVLKPVASDQRAAIGFVITFSYAYDSQAKEDVMAQRVEVILEDDIDGGPANETVRFA